MFSEFSFSHRSCCAWNYDMVTRSGIKISICKVTLQAVDRGMLSDMVIYFLIFTWYRVSLSPWLYVHLLKVSCDPKVGYIYVLGGKVHLVSDGSRFWGLWLCRLGFGFSGIDYHTTHQVIATHNAIKLQSYRLPKLDKILIATLDALSLCWDLILFHEISVTHFSMCKGLWFVTQVAL